MMSEADILQLLMRRTPGYSLAQPFYTDPDLFQTDVMKVFGTQWLFAAPAQEIPKPGNYVTLQIGPYSVIVVRGADRKIRAFHNSCRHRGSRICAASKGSAPKLVCPYHQWTYELDGRLLFARDMGAGFDLTAHGLKPVHVAEAAGLVFICLADQAPDFAPLQREAVRYIGPHDLGNAKIAHQSTILEKANWKLVLENNRECYHCSGSHPSLCRTFPDNPDLVGSSLGEAATEGAAHIARCEAAGLPSAYVLDPSETWRFVRIPFLGDAVSYTMDGKAAVATGIGHVPVQDAGTCLFFSYPNTWCHFLHDQALVFRVLPVSPQETQVTTTWLVHGEAEEGRDYDLNRLTEVWLHTNDEDRQIVEENQVGINSPAYVPGPYSQRQESGVIQFIDWYARTLERKLLGRIQVAAE
ncbi:Rieske 2Fe-2S family protein [Roseibium hamelinense]|uniref:Rieske 2Fe-2S family protein n=1 Tax=Roseibium hamelinense TaxID=150831 RepID=A0A562TAE6_9HYPH|nr:aromatic ring-hydroxylating dioxygenase subunit alpha [Roseibium hamelinense]MTI45541.1 aromatic ring-hydroxylating dioxygenase subunit alpha [Roseibium hamelinense]TWI90084.1 Rieske 2Fe-2S family protein [Roseibium hamelinense]